MFSYCYAYILALQIQTWACGQDQTVFTAKCGIQCVHNKAKDCVLHFLLLMCYSTAEVFNPGPQGPPVLHVLDVSLLQHT